VILCFVRYWSGQACTYHGSRLRVRLALTAANLMVWAKVGHCMLSERLTQMLVVSWRSRRVRTVAFWHSELDIYVCG